MNYYTAIFVQFLKIPFMVHSYICNKLYNLAVYNCLRQEIYNN